MRAVHDIRCSDCRSAIPIGQPVRRGDRSPVAWCPACAKRRIDEDVPDPLPALEPVRVTGCGHMGTFVRDLSARIVGSE